MGAMKTKRLLIAAAVAVLLAGAGLAAPPAYLLNAVADPSRPPEDVKRDPDRKPAETLALAGVKPGVVVVDLLPGGGYFTRIMSDAVGPAGHVYAAVPAVLASNPRMAPAVAGLKDFAAAHPNTEVLLEDVSVTLAPKPVDVVFTAQNYHDFHNFPGEGWKAINKAAYEALKPGGTYLIVDHVAAAGAGATQTKTLHRIEPSAITTEVEAAGFKLVETSEILKNPADDHLKTVFDPAIRGKTDQIILKFKKV
jgi:predicted methyltransferase